MNPYLGYYTPPPIPMQQQRLNEYEQQFNPYQGQMQQPMGQPMGQPIGQQMQQPNFIKCRAVTSIDEAKASMIDLDGSIHVFTDVGNKRIYTKQINLDGTATLNTYVLKNPEPEREPERENMPDFVKHEELESVCQALNNRITLLLERIDDLEYELAAPKAEPPKPEPKPRGGAKK